DRVRRLPLCLNDRGDLEIVAALRSEFDVGQLSLISRQVVLDPTVLAPSVDAVDEVGVQRSVNQRVLADGSVGLADTTNQVKQLLTRKRKTRRANGAARPHELADRARVVLRSGGYPDAVPSPIVDGRAALGETDVGCLPFIAHLHVPGLKGSASEA